MATKRKYVEVTLEKNTKLCKNLEMKLFFSIYMKLTVRFSDVFRG